ncbi:alpha/beta hydrolase fold domain-containing protein [Mucilaginibacter jinjuensis]|uniref:Alpha/beta hydrolase fold domain-containing protein n=1 Tax=Mucilaginibacter jinjuensis TaxID=1176721 RepID=A0ABY7TA71_9SPHI|nr:alpha/beta hydrolase fold domain-containing protein [Mucilaginibacter jinjuensis]WCT13241.1 alpha/beta hydrolase fold domain-containing protein [Mucilaginibacter jinjuensis]
MPPTTVITDEIGPLLSEGKQLADKLKAEGVQTDSNNYVGVTHGFSVWAQLFSWRRVLKHTR